MINLETPQTKTNLDRESPPWAETSWTETPLDREPRHHLRTVNSGRYASYWNAFLLIVFTGRNKAATKVICLPLSVILFTEGSAPDPGGCLPGGGLLLVPGGLPRCGVGYWSRGVCYWSQGGGLPRWVCPGPPPPADGYCCDRYASCLTIFSSIVMKLTKQLKRL